MCSAGYTVPRVGGALVGTLNHAEMYSVTLQDSSEGYRVVFRTIRHGPGGYLSIKCLLNTINTVNTPISAGTPYRAQPCTFRRE